MKIGFHGAARCVTGSKHLLTLKDDTKILLDCGLFQGMGKQTDDLNQEFGFDPASIYCLIVSHAHIDHTGLIPKLVKEGFKGKIFSTAATKDLAEILMYDSAEIQTYELDYINKRRAAKNQPLFDPLYDHTHVKEAVNLFETIDFNEWFTINDSVKLMFTHAGHLIGSAAVNLQVTENGKTTSLAFSGDIGRYNSTLLKPPAEFPKADYIILESTYGNKMHDLIFNTIDTLRDYIRMTCEKKQGKLIIPAFSVGRTQEVLYAINQLSIENRLPNFKYFVDSPLSTKATAVIKSYKEEYNDKLQKVLEIDDDPFDFEGLHYIESVEESRQLVDYKEPCVIISASGTADAGRVKHHINACIGDAKNTVLLVGYCQEFSLGGQLLGGAKEVEIFGDDIPVKAEIASMKSMSAHGDCDDLARFMSCQDATSVKKVFLVHGDNGAQAELAERLKRKGFENVEIPALHSEVELN